MIRPSGLLLVVPRLFAVPAVLSSLRMGLQKSRYITKLGCEKYFFGNVLRHRRWRCSYYKAKSRKSVSCVFFPVWGTGSSRPLHQTPARYQLIRVSKLITTGIKKSNTRLTMICNHGYDIKKYPFVIIYNHGSQFF
jgi:hypothetical protein